MKHLKPKFLAVALFCLGLTGLNAQINIDVPDITCPPEIDGVEERFWDEVDPVQIGMPEGTEQPTVTAYWKAVFDHECIYVIINVEDDNHYPAWVSEGNSWEYDKPEIYFDVNDTLVDGLRPSTLFCGHYQFAPGFEMGGYGDLHTAAGTGNSPGGTYAYVLQGESYVYEQAITISSMSNKNGVAMEYWTITYLPENIGFDVTIVDQDEGITTSRQRMVWQSGDGSESEAWNSMDACGTIALSQYYYIHSCNRINEIKTVNVAVHPNPVNDFLTIDADFDRVVIHTILGQNISTMNQIRTNKLDVGYLSKGVYILKVYKGERYIGAARIMKN